MSSRSPQPTAEIEGALLMPTHTCPIVGAHFRPPAKSILSALPNSCPLRLRPEPDNPYDSNALQVLVSGQVIRDLPEAIKSDLHADAVGYGYDIDTICAAEEWHLGYIPRGIAAQLHAIITQEIAVLYGKMLFYNLDIPRDYLPAQLTFDLAGKPAVQFQLSDKEGVIVSSK